MARSAVTLDGEREVNRLLSGLVKSLDKNVLARAADAGAQVVELAIKAKTPVKTGNLLASVGRHKWQGSAKGEGSQIVGPIGPSGPHAGLVEFGHGGINPAPAHPFVRPAADQARDEAQAAISHYLQTYLGRVI